MKAHTGPTGDGREVVWLTFTDARPRLEGTPRSAYLLTTTPEHAARITAAVNAPSCVGRPLINALSSPGYLNLRLAARENALLHSCPAPDCGEETRGWDAFLLHIYHVHTDPAAAQDRRQAEVQALLERSRG